jgi:hypothetical protein
MSQSLQPELEALPLFRFAIRTEQELEDALDAWLADDRIDEDREHVLTWMREDREREAR